MISSKVWENLPSISLLPQLCHNKGWRIVLEGNEGSRWRGIPLRDGRLPHLLLSPAPTCCTSYYRERGWRGCPGTQYRKETESAEHFCRFVDCAAQALTCPCPSCVNCKHVFVPRSVLCRLLCTNVTISPPDKQVLFCRTELWARLMNVILYYGALLYWKNM